MTDETRKVIMCDNCRDEDDSWENRNSLLISNTELENAPCPVCNKLCEDGLWEYEFFSAEGRCALDGYERDGGEYFCSEQGKSAFKGTNSAGYDYYCCSQECLDECLRLEELENFSEDDFDELDDTDFGGKGHPDAF